MHKLSIVVVILLLAMLFVSCGKTTDLNYSKRAEEYADAVEKYDKDSAEYRAYCRGFDAGWDNHSEQYNVEEAKEKGWKDGYNEGHSDGYYDGYDEGNEAGIESCYEDIRNSFCNSFASGLHEGYYVGYLAAQKGEKCEYNLYDYSWYQGYYEEEVDIGYKSGYVYGYIVGYSNYCAGVDYYEDMFY